MIPWKRIETAAVPGSGETLSLYRRGDEFSIRGDGFELMNSRMHRSEEDLARLACQRIRTRPRPCVLIGGLGMGFTLAAALRELGPESRVAVAELVPAVVAWNRGPLGRLAGHPLDDQRVTVHEIDVIAALQAVEETYDAIVLDVDNGPDGLTRAANDGLYGFGGLAAAHRALAHGGVLAVWSARPDNAFAMRLQRSGYHVQTIRTGARSRGRAGQHTIWLAGKRAIPAAGQSSDGPASNPGRPDRHGRR